MRVLKRVLTVLIVIFVIAGGAGFLLPRTAQLSRSIRIEAPPATVFAVLNGFRNFDKWSPWADLDPAMKVSLDGATSGVGAGYHWSGNSKVGSGSQEISASKPNETVDIRLVFGNTPPSHAQFRIAPDGSGSQVSWSFDADLGNNPYMRYFVPLMVKAVGADYERGLGRMKTFIEGLPKADISGLDAKLETVAATPYLYVKASSSTEPADIGRAYTEAHGKLLAAMQAANIKADGAPLAVTHRWDPTAKVYEADVGMPVADGVAASGEGVMLGKTYAGQALHIEYKGPYDGLGHVYEQIALYKRAYGLQDNGDNWEQYKNDPASTPPAELLTVIEVPVK
jgi:effector-binding domain-containing protein